MKPAQLIIFGALAFFGIKAFSKASAAGKLQFFVSKVALRFSGLTPILDFILGIQNPTNETLRVGSIVGQLFINGDFCANISGYQLTDVKNYATSYFPISARLSTSGLITQVVQIVEGVIDNGVNSLANQVLTFRGTVNAEGVSVPLNFNYKVL